MFVTGSPRSVSSARSVPPDARGEMKFNARKAPLAPPGVTGIARVGKPTSTLLPRLRPGDIAVLDHVDLDRDSATALVEAGVRVVVNAAPMISGRYANLGPEVLAEAGVLLVDRVGKEGIGPDQGQLAHPGRRRGDLRRTARRPDRGARHRPRRRPRSGAQRDGPGPQRPGRPAGHAHAHHQRLPAPRARAAAQRPRPPRADHPDRRPPGRRRRRRGPRRSAGNRPVRPRAGTGGHRRRRRRRRPARPELGP